ncbi:MAG: zinc ribbon domain-containing protein [Planctomycetota bacterium]|nr:zinc ribbon domain-containing protein [Planctomycetota bacterium]
MAESSPRTTKECPQCKARVEAATRICQCGHVFMDSSSQTIDISKEELPHLEKLKDVAVVQKILKMAAEQQVSWQELIDSLDLTWENLGQVNSMEQLENLKARAEFRGFVEKHGLEPAKSFIAQVEKTLDEK